MSPIPHLTAPQNPLANALSLESFATAQFSYTHHQDIHDSTFNLICVTVFFQGAVDRMMQENSPIDNPIERILQIHLHINHTDNRGLLNSIMRLSDKYTLLTEIRTQGFHAADKWLGGRDRVFNDLQTILQKHQGMGMLDLASLGIEQVDKKKSVVQSTTVNQIKRATSPRGLLFVILCMLGLLLVVGWIYFLSI